MERRGLDRLTPADAAVALRSFARRFRESVRPDELDGTGLDVTVTPPGVARSPLTVLITTTALLRRRTAGLERVLAEPPGRLDADDRPGGPPPALVETPGGLPGAFEEFQRAVDALADLAARTPLPGWDRAVELAGVPVRAGDLLRDAVAVGRDGLDEFVAALRAARAATA